MLDKILLCGSRDNAMQVGAMFGSAHPASCTTIYLFYHIMHQYLYSGFDHAKDRPPWIKYLCDSDNW